MRSNPSSADPRLRMCSRSMRLSRLRSTARPRSFLPITKPTRAVVPERARASSCKRLPSKRRPLRNTAANAAEPRGRWRWVKQEQARRRRSHGESNAALAASRAQNFAAPDRFHSSPEPMGPLPPDHGGLVCAFHVYALLGKKLCIRAFCALRCQGASHFGARRCVTLERAIECALKSFPHCG